MPEVRLTGCASSEDGGLADIAEVLKLLAPHPDVDYRAVHRGAGEWVDPYTGRATCSPGDLQMTLVALGDARRSGASVLQAELVPRDLGGAEAWCNGADRAVWRRARSRALAVFIVFGAVAVLIGRTALNNWREGRRDADSFLLWVAFDAMGPAIIAGVIALVAPSVTVDTRDDGVVRARELVGGAWPRTPLPG